MSKNYKNVMPMSDNHIFVMTEKLFSRKLTCCKKIFDFYRLLSLILSFRLTNLLYM